MAINEILVLKDVLLKDRSIVFAYLFGSRATGTASARSDWDIAVYINDELLEGNPVWQKFRIEDRLAVALGTDAVEVVVLNRMDNPLLAFEIVNKGILLVEHDEDVRLAYECRALGHYHDWRYFMDRHMKSEGYQVVTH